MNQRSLTIILACFVFAFIIPCVYAATIQVDKTATATAVINGTHFTLNTGETVQLASIITPSMGQPGYESSTSYLTSLIQGQTVYLTIDTALSNPNKLVCTAYLNYNASHYENINMAMLVNHYATSNSVPDTWTWFVAKQTATPTPTATATVIPTASPSPTPFSAPTPSVNPSSIISETPAPTAQAQSSDFTLPTWLIIVVIAIAAILVTAAIYKRKKNKK
jgi:hypothetical protein